jgi:cytochrome c oxidase subunit 3
MTAPRVPGAPVPAQTGVIAGLAAVTMTFAAFTSALVMRQGAPGDWLHFDLPPILFANSGVLIASSVTLEIARRRLARGLPDGSAWLTATLLLGVLFLVGQIVAWRSLAAQGVFLSSSASSAFFYVLTAVHGLHLLGGLAGLTYVRARVRRMTPAPLGAVGAAAAYWHFMDGLWIYVFLLLALRV